MPNIATHHQWLIEENVLSFLWSYPVSLPVFAGVGIVPVKPGATFQRIPLHTSSIRLSYTDTKDESSFQPH